MKIQLPACAPDWRGMANLMLKFVRFRLANACVLGRGWRIQLAVVLVGSVLLSGCTRKAPVESKLTFWQRQLDQLLDDRPRMRGVISEDSPIRKWVAEAFDGNLTGRRVFWNAENPRSGRSAEHLPYYASWPAPIRISGGTEKSPIDNWAMLVFELNNLAENNLEKLYAESLAGGHTAESFARECVRFEFQALQKTRDFFGANPIEDSNSARDVWYSWLVNELPEFEDYERAWTNKDYPAEVSNFKYFQRYFEENIGPHLGDRNGNTSLHSESPK